MTFNQVIMWIILICAPFTVIASVAGGAFLQGTANRGWGDNRRTIEVDNND